MSKAVDLAGRRVLVTGAASGIGLALARALCTQGATLALVDIDQGGLAAAVAALDVAPERVRALCADVRDAGQVEAAVTAAASAFGALDGLVNCAGVYPNQPLLEMSDEDFDRVIAINLRGPFLFLQAVARVMRDAGGTVGGSAGRSTAGSAGGSAGGSIVNVSSTASVLARPGIAHYGASKAGLNQLTRIAAVELAPFGIRVNAVLPGVIATERVLHESSSEAARRELDAKVGRIPVARLGEPEEVVSMVTFLLSDAASYCTGGLYTVDGGFSLGMSKY